MATKTRSARVERVTRETEIHVTLSLDGAGRAEIATPIPLFSRLLEGFCRYGNLDVTLDVVGDVEIDQHDAVEHTGLALGEALREALGDRTGIRQAASAFVPVEEALALCALDLSGRPFCAFEAAFGQDELGGLETDLLPEFFRALARESRATWHLRVEAGEDEGHKIEALFRAAGRAVRDAASRDPGGASVISGTNRPRE